MTTTLVENFSNIDELKIYFGENIHHLSEFKYDYYIKGKNFCVEKYGTNIQIIKTLSKFSKLEVININCKYENNIEEIDKLFFENINSYENMDIIKTFSYILALYSNINHRLYYEETLDDEYSKYKHTEIYNAVHIMNHITLDKIIELLNFEIYNTGNKYNTYFLFLYNYNVITSKLIEKIYTFDLEYEILDFFNVTNIIFKNIVP